ncbi:hypothetical protein GJ496_003983 [Pomphorhynchus laevis]|nr:hypothetical protein GJ496_003983 [Pomphorhynchus laevis]
MMLELDIFDRFVDKLISWYPNRCERNYDILFKQTGFLLDSADEMVLLCHRMAIIAAIRSINQGAAVGIMIARSSGPWYSNGIILIDPNGNFLPRPYINVAENLLNCDNKRAKGTLKSMIKRLAFSLKDHALNILSNTLGTDPYAHCRKEHVDQAIIPDNQNNLDEHEMFLKEYADERRDTATVIIGYDTRARNHIYASIISKVCAAFNVKCYCVGYTTTPLLGYIVFARNGRLFKADELPIEDDYVMNVTKAVLHLEAILEELKQRNDDKASIEDSNDFDGINELASSIKITRNDLNVLSTNVVVDTGNSVVAPFFFKVVNNLSSFGSLFATFKILNTQSVDLYNKQNEITSIRCEIGYQSIIQYTIRLCPTNGNNINLAIANVTNNCGADYVNKHEALPFNLNCLRRSCYIHPIHCCSFDGDGDKLVFYYQASNVDSTIKILNGDRIAVLFVKFLKSLFDRIRFINPKIVVLLNSFSNTASAKYITSNFGVSVIKTIDCPLEMYTTGKTFPLCVYFTVNGHGNVLIQNELMNEIIFLRLFLFQAINCESKSWINLRSFLKYKRSYEKYLNEKDVLIDELEACDILLRLFNLLFQSSSDAFRNFFAIEFILAHEKLNLMDWYTLYEDIPSFKIYWHPDLDISCYLSATDLSAFSNIQMANENVYRNRTEFIQQKLIKLMIIAGTKRCGDIEIDNLSSEEIKILKYMDNVANKEYIKGFNTFIDLASISALWYPTYKIIAQSRFLFCLSLILDSISKQNFRVVICPDENDSQALIYIESVSILDAQFIAFTIMLLLRVHVESVIKVCS